MYWLLVYYVYFVIFLLKRSVYNNYLHIKSLKLAIILFNSAFLSLFYVAFVKNISSQRLFLCPRRGIFSPFVEGGKHLSTPLILRFSFEKSLKSTDFYLFWFLFCVGKDNLHYSV